MPHATDDMAQQPPTNGVGPTSKFLSHASSYPVVHDGIETFKQHPYGKKSLEIADGAYQKFGKPVEGYLETPYSYVKPYVEKADAYADAGLGQVETRFPIVKEETGTVVDSAKGLALWPYKYLTQTWNDEYEKTAKHNDRGPGISTSVLAIISTELKIASDFFQSVADFLGPKYEETKKQGAAYVQKAEDTVEHYKQLGQDKLDDYTKLGHKKVDEVKTEAEKKKEQVIQQAQGAKEEAEKKASN